MGAETIGAVAAVVSAIAGAGSAVYSMTQGSKTADIKPAPVASAEPDKPSVDKVADAADVERRRLLSRSGRAGTISTSGLGLVGSGQPVTRTLLGGI